MEALAAFGRRSSDRRSAEGNCAITPFFIAAQVIAYLAFTAGWLGGGRPERFATGVLTFDYLLTAMAYYRLPPGALGVEIISEATVALILLWMAFRSPRWWPFVSAAALTLCVLVYVLEWIVPGLSKYAAKSAQIGLWIVAYLALLSGTVERWLAGERPVSGAVVWLRRRVAS